MTTTIEVTFENSVLHPSKPLDWKECERHTVTVQDNISPVILPVDPPDPERAKRIVAEIIAMPLEGTGQRFSGTDDDRILYGGPQGAEQFLQSYMEFEPREYTTG